MPIHIAVRKCTVRTRKEHELLTSPFSPDGERFQLMKKPNEEFAKCFGLFDRSAENEYQVDDKKALKIQVFGVERKDGFMSHYGFLFPLKKQNYVIHINSYNKTVSFEKTEDAFNREKLKPDFKAIYTFMLPWIDDAK
ncbi:MAG: hypothetical protein K1060chlam1_00288 [Candidatus Anoxychlamydiales bacterium]|nr:hypothetical protein [Candidatus Anoxychlamydiales bacterium]